MSFFDDASLVFLPSGQAGKDGKAYSMKPVPEYGSELVTNGGFDTDTWWEKGTGWSISNGYASVSNGAFARLATPPSPSQILVVGKQYKCTFEVVESEGGELYVESNINVAVLTGVTALGIHSVTFTAQDDQIRFQARNNSLISIDNVSVREVVVGDGDFTFSRGSNLTATRVDSNGLIEKGRENLLLQSNQFDTTWVSVTASVTSGQSGYDGSNDAWLLSKSAASGRIYQNASVSGVATYSVYAKSNDLDWLFIIGTPSSYPEAYFNLSNGTIGNTSNHQNFIGANIEDVGNGWYRCSITFNDSLGQFRIYPADGNNDFSGTSGSIYIQDAQLEQGLVATEYIESGATSGLAGILEDSPRFDYSGGASCPSLLLEPSRTNLVASSEYTGGYSAAGVSATQNVAISPEGLQNATEIIESAALGGHDFVSPSFSVVSGTTYTTSIFVKKNVGTRNAVVFAGNSSRFSNGRYVVFNASTGATIQENGTAVGDFEDMGNGWLRLIVTATATSSGSNIIALSFANVTALSYTGDGTSSFYCYGFQCEEGSYPTSYIPNHSGGSVTREADTPSNASAASIIGQTEGTIFIDFLYESNPAGNRFSISDGTATNWIFIATPESGTSSRFYIRVNNSVIVDVGSSSYFVDGTRYKLALAYKSRDWAVYGNGTQLYVGTDNIPSFSSPMNTINFKSFNPSDAVTEKEKINQVLFFDTRISNGNLATLTS